MRGGLLILLVGFVLVENVRKEDYFEVFDGDIVGGDIFGGDVIGGEDIGGEFIGG